MSTGVFLNEDILDVGESTPPFGFQGELFSSSDNSWSPRNSSNGPITDDCQDLY